MLYWRTNVALSSEWLVHLETALGCAGNLIRRVRIAVRRGSSQRIFAFVVSVPIQCLPSNISCDNLNQFTRALIQRAFGDHNVYSRYTCILAYKENFNILLSHCLDKHPHWLVWLPLKELNWSQFLKLLPIHLFSTIF